MRKLLALTASAALLAGCEEPAYNQADPAATNAAAAEAEADAESADTVRVDRDTALRLMEERHENYERIGDAMKVATRQLRGDSPDLAEVRTAATTIATLAPQIPSWFPAGTGPDVGETEALAEIWQEPEDFATKARALERNSAAFQAAAQGEDLAAIRAAHAELGKSCKACHDLYREDH